MITKSLKVAKITTGMLGNPSNTPDVFLDISKAFDTIHRHIMFKLEHYSVRGVVHKWFRRLLSDRQQFVHHCKYNSTSKHLIYYSAPYWGICSSSFILTICHCLCKTL